MPKEKGDEPWSEADLGTAIDRDVRDVMREEGRRGRRRSAVNIEAERKKKKLAELALKAIKAKDARIFTELLRQAGIREGSPEWKNAWQAFDSA